MELILKEDIIGLGYKNDIVKVKDGYGRNYLIPTGKAVIANASSKKVLAENLRQQAAKLERVKAEAQAKGEQIANAQAIVIATKVSANGTIYGSVNSLHLAEALQAQGIEVNRKSIVVKDVKEVGQYVAKVCLHKEVEVELPFTVVAENQPVAEAPAEVPAEEVAVVEEVVEEAPAQEEEVSEEA